MTTPVQEAIAASNQAAEAIRTLNLLTQPADGAPGLGEPADMYEVIADMATVARRQPQLFAQMSRQLSEAYGDGRVGHDSGADAREAVADVLAALGDAGYLATALEDALSRAQNACAGLNPNPREPR